MRRVGIFLLVFLTPFLFCGLTLTSTVLVRSFVHWDSFSDSLNSLFNELSPANDYVRVIYLIWFTASLVITVFISHYKFKMNRWTQNLT
jgi:hypothetical protein